jgi:hypothetical protein
MKIEIELDIEAIVREEIRKYVQENLVIRNVTKAAIHEATTPIVNDQPDLFKEEAATAVTVADDTESDIPWEYSPKIGKRRNKAEIAMHEKELELGRLLTPEEKGATQANIEMADERELKAKEDAKHKAHIDELARHGLAAADKELAEEAAKAATAPEESEDDNPDSSDDTDEEKSAWELPDPKLLADSEEDSEEDTVMPGEATIPKADNLSVLDSLFK